MAESVTFTTPIVTSTTVSSVQILSVFIQRAMYLYDWKLEIKYMDNMGNMAVDTHSGVVGPLNPRGADQLVIALNKSNLTVKSLERLALEHLIGEGLIPASTFVGSPT
jgi:hypothetical protein